MTDAARTFVRYHAKHTALAREVQAGPRPEDTDPTIRADMALAALESAVQWLFAVDPQRIDGERLAALSGDLRELALTAWRMRQ